LVEGETLNDLDPGFAPAPGEGGFATGSVRNIASEVDNQNDRETWSVTGTLDWRLNDIFRLKTITNYRESDVLLVQDLDWSRVVNDDIQRNTVASDQFSQELQLHFESERLRGLIGAYYFNEEFFNTNDIGFQRPSDGPTTFVLFTGDIDIENAAVFGNVTYDITDKIALNAGARFRLVITNDTINFGGPQVVVNQAAVAPYSEIIGPLLQPIEITDITFWNASGDDAPGCTPNCGSQVDPPFVTTGNTIWVRATMTDIFGSFDINTGCDTLASTTNCPTVTITDPNGGDQTPGSNAMSFLRDPTTTSRQFEFEISPGTGGDGLEGTWQVEIEASEGVEDVFTDVRTAGFDRFGPPQLLIVKSVSGPTNPGSIVTYNNDITNSGTGPAYSVTITNSLGDFQSIELTASGGNWTGVSSLGSPYPVQTESFDDGSDTFTYDPTGFCGAATPANSPCYDPTIEAFRILIDEIVPVGDNFEQEYRAQIDP